MGNVFENLGVEFYSTEMFLGNGFIKMELEMEKRDLVVLQMTLVITRYPPEQLTRATTLPRYGIGLSP
jgi:hypothetical protein